MKNKQYKRSKTDSVLYCPFCGHGFRMTMERYFATYRARDRGEPFTRTSCGYCAQVFYFRNITPEYLRAGHKAILKPEEYKIYFGGEKMYTINILTNEDYVRKHEPTEYKHIRTASFTTARILLTDDYNHMYTIRPLSVRSIDIRPEEVFIDEE